MRDARHGSGLLAGCTLPKTSFIGFTGAPIESGDKDTQAVFGDLASKDWLVPLLGATESFQGRSDNTSGSGLYSAVKCERRFVGELF